MTDKYQTALMWKFGRDARMMAGRMNSNRRVAVLSKGGSVLPIPWKTLDDVKIIPIATKFSEMIWRYSPPKLITLESWVKARMKSPPQNCARIVSSTMIAVVIRTAE